MVVAKGQKLAMVFSDSMSLIGLPPTSAALGPPLPFSPWHTAHFAAKIRAPSAGVPLPGGRPVPSGRMLMSQAAISAGLIGVPRFGAWAKAVLEARASMNTTTDSRSLGIDMLDLPAAFDCPGCDRVVVLTGKTCYRRNPRGLAALGHDLGSGGLRVAGLVPCAAL